MSAQRLQFALTIDTVEADVLHTAFELQTANELTVELIKVLDGKKEEQLFGNQQARMMSHAFGLDS